MKRGIAIVIAMLIVVFANVIGVNGESGKYALPELQRAVTLGIGTYSEKSAVTYQQFLEMLDAAVYLSDSSKLVVWQEKLLEARKSTKVMTRQEGMLAVYYAAETLGENYCAFNANPDWSVINKKIGESCWDELIWDYPLFPEWEKPVTLVHSWDNYMITAYFYSFGRESLYSGETIFNYDTYSNSMRLTQPLTYQEALLAALRLHDSGLEPSERIPTLEDRAFLSQVEENRKAILDSMTEVTVTGTSYYVSNTGNDSNNGLSPETAWATLHKVNTTKLQYGDGVFFQRGGVWRSGPFQGQPPHCGNGVLYAQNGVTYSAYGEGEKPKIFGSPENGADPDKWKLIDDTHNIWVFYKDMQDCGGIVLNDGESMAYKTCAFWDGSKYCKSSNGKNADLPRESFDIKTLENLRFFNEIYYPDKDAAGYFSTEGKLYFRCDEGNPGSVYSSMEFLTGNNDWNEGFASGQMGCVFDNICFLYGTGGISIINNGTVQNCEIGWLGGQILQYSGSNLGDDTEGVIVRSGDGIMTFGVNNTVKNNYIHDVYDYGITIEGFAANPEESSWKRKNTIITGNIVEKGYGSMLIVDWYAWEKKLNLPSFTDLLVDGNYFLRSGYGWSHQATGEYTGSITMYFHPGSINNIKISNNVFYLSKYTLVLLASDSEDMRPFFSGNTYVQNELSNMVGRLIMNSSEQTFTPYSYQPYFLVHTITDVLGDKSAMFFDQPEPSSWAVAGVDMAISRGLATPELRYRYQLNTTRAEFCRAAVNFLENYYEKPIDKVLRDKGLAPIIFKDVQDEAISAAAALGLTGGTGNGNFSPNNPLTREQAATMLNNTLKCIGINTVYSDAGFTDANSFSTWAVDAISSVYYCGIMSGTGIKPKTFSPKAAYTHEQSILTFNNLFNYLMKNNLME